MNSLQPPDVALEPTGDPAGERARSLDVVIVSFNTRDILRECLRSVLASARDVRVRILVVDNASKDGSPEMVEGEFPSVELIRSTVNLGFAAGNNLAIARTTAPLVLLLNSDTVVEADTIDRCVAWMDGRPEITVASPPVFNRDGSPQAHCSRFPNWNSTLGSVLGFRSSHFAVSGREVRERGTVRVPCVAGCVMFCRGDWLRGAGGFDPRYPFFGEDADLCRRCLAEGGQVAVIDAGSIVHLGGASTDAASGKRGGLLVNAIVAYNRKWHSEASARLVWAAYLLYFGSRSLGYRFRATLGRTASRERADRSWKVFRLLVSAPVGAARADLG